MGRNVGENFGVLAAVSELNALTEDDPLMRQVMLRLASAYRELAERARARGGMAHRYPGKVVEIGQRVGASRRQPTIEPVGRAS